MCPDLFSEKAPCGSIRVSDPLSLCILRGRLREVRLDFLLASDIFGGHVFKYNDPQTVALDLEVDKKKLAVLYYQI